MDRYIGTRIVDAEQMTRREAYKKGYYRLTEGDDIHNYQDDNGYHIHYETGYDSWCPAKEFEQRNKPINPLRETAIQMNSNDYKDRFIAEYKQLALRYKALVNMCIKWDNSELDFIPTCPREIYDDQLLCMKQYLSILEKRAKLENINLN
jgi:hypothetical protein